MTLEEFRANVFKFMQEDKWDLAAVSIARYFKEDPLDDEIRSVCGLIYSSMESNGIEFEPMTSEEFLWRGICRRTDTMDIFEALRDYGRAVKLNPTNHYALKWRAQWYHKATLFKEAKTDLLKAISISEQAEYYNDLAKVCTSEQDYESALFYNHKAVALKPGYDAYLFNTGWTFQLLGKKEYAEAIYDKLKITPDFWKPIS